MRRYLTTKINNAAMEDKKLRGCDQARELYKICDWLPFHYLSIFAAQLLAARDFETNRRTYLNL